MRRFPLAALAALAVSGAAFAQDQPQDTTTTQVTATTTETMQGRSTLGALAVILANRTPEEALALVHCLDAIQNHTGPSFGSNSGFMATEKVILGSLSGDEANTLQTAWNNMSGFDKESFTILARAAFFGGLSSQENTGGERPLRVFGDTNMWRTGFAPVGTPVIVEQVALDSTCAKLGAGGDAFRAAIQKIDGGANEHPRNMGFMNAQKVLMDNIDESSRDTFMTAWNAMDYSDREAALVLVRDAFFGGLNDQ